MAAGRGGCQSPDGIDNPIHPDLTCTKGVANPAVTAATLAETICKPGYTSTIRPPASYTDRLKVQQIAAYGFVDKDPSHYREDHWWALEAGGDPRDPQNLWPQPTYTNPNSYSKDSLERAENAYICEKGLDPNVAYARMVEMHQRQNADWVVLLHALVQGNAGQEGGDQDEQ